MSRQRRFPFQRASTSWTKPDADDASDAHTGSNNNNYSNNNFDNNAEEQRVQRKAIKTRPQTAAVSSTRTTTTAAATAADDNSDAGIVKSVVESPFLLSVAAAVHEAIVGASADDEDVLRFHQQLLEPPSDSGKWRLATRIQMLYVRKRLLDRQLEEGIHKLCANHCTTDEYGAVSQCTTETKSCKLSKAILESIGQAADAARSEVTQLLYSFSLYDIYTTGVSLYEKVEALESALQTLDRRLKQFHHSASTFIKCATSPDSEAKSDALVKHALSVVGRSGRSDEKRRTLTQAASPYTQNTTSRRRGATVASVEAPTVNEDVLRIAVASLKLDDKNAYAFVVEVLKHNTEYAKHHSELTNMKAFSGAISRQLGGAAGWEVDGVRQLPNLHLTVQQIFGRAAMAAAQFEVVQQLVHTRIQQQQQAFASMTTDSQLPIIDVLDVAVLDLLKHTQKRVQERLFDRLPMFIQQIANGDANITPQTVQQLFSDVAAMLDIVNTTFYHVYKQNTREIATIIIKQKQ
jgi:hypothetical protein